MSVRMLMTMAESHDVKEMKGDVENAFPYALSLEKVHEVDGKILWSGKDMLNKLFRVRMGS